MRISSTRIVSFAQRATAAIRYVVEPVARALFRRLFQLGLYHTPSAALDFLKYPCTVDGGAFARATGFTPLFSLEDIFASVRH